VMVPNNKSRIGRRSVENFAFPTFQVHVSFFRSNSIYDDFRMLSDILCSITYLGQSRTLRSTVKVRL